MSVSSLRALVVSVLLALGASVVVASTGSGNGGFPTDVRGPRSLRNGGPWASLPLSLPRNDPASPAGPALNTPAWMGEANQADANFGYCLSTAGDVNGDGYDDVLVGAYRYDAGGVQDCGRVFLYQGSASGPSAAPAWTAQGTQMQCQFGVTVASAGDVNGDGYDDIVVGAPFWSTNFTAEGRAFLWLGSATGPSTTPAWVYDGGQEQSLFGYCVAPAGDVNGDGYDDVIVGQLRYNGQVTHEGKVLVFLGSPAGLSAQPNWKVVGDQSDSNFGFWVSSAGDVNGDGYDDVIFGANAYDGAQEMTGRAFLYLGSPTGLGTTPAWMKEGDQAEVCIGTVVAAAGDVNGDGFDDVLLGIPSFDTPVGGDAGRVQLYLGSAQGLSSEPIWSGENFATGSWYGYSAATAGDVDHDGFSDIIASAPLHTSHYSWEGEAYVYHGSPAGPTEDDPWMESGQQWMAAYGGCVSTAGDVNGDGFSDILVGAPFFDHGQQNEGTAYVYLGPTLGAAPSSVLSLPPSGPTLDLFFPDPFGPGNPVQYRMPSGGPCRLVLFDAGGRLVTRLFDGRTGRSGAVTWDGRDSHGRRAARGLYFLRLENDRSGVTRRLVLLGD